MALPSIFQLTRTFKRHPLFMIHLLDRKLRMYRRDNQIRDMIDTGLAPSPIVYKLTLTLKCNLKCKMCMYWGNTGWCKNEDRDIITRELDFETVSHFISDVSKNRPSFILSGGEPLLYSKFDKIAGILKQKRCFAYICTNGLFLHKYLSLISTNRYLTFLVSLDGLGKVNDRIRGQNVYERVRENVRRLKTLKKPPYLGIQFTVQPENVHHMYDFCQEMKKWKVDWILFNMCWFLSERQARDYRKVIEERAGIQAKTHLGYLFPFPIDKEEFIRQFTRIRNTKWPFQVSCYLKNPEEIYTFVDTPHLPVGNRFCFKQWLRMDITPTGDVTPCAQFPDLTFGNIAEQNMLEIWNSPAYGEFRKTIGKQLLPVCSKCDVLYLYDAKRKYL